MHNDGSGRVLATPDAVPLASAAPHPKTRLISFRNWIEEPNGEFRFPMIDISKFPDQALREDTCGTDDTGIIQTSHMGIDYSQAVFPRPIPDPTFLSGWRSGVVEETGVGNVLVMSHNDLTVPAPNQGGGPLVAYVFDAFSLAMGSWYNAGVQVIELGPIANEAKYFQYDDWGLLPLPLGFVPSWILPEDGDLTNSKGWIVTRQDDEGVWWVWAGINEWRCVGPVPMREDIAGSTMHGTNLDVFVADVPSNTWGQSIYEYNGPIPPENPPPDINVADPVKQSGTVIDVPIPDDFTYGDCAVLYVGTAAGSITTPSGWQIVNTGLVTGCRGTCFTRLITEDDDADPWWTNATLPVAHSSGDAAAVMVRIRGQAWYRYPGFWNIVQDATIHTNTNLATQPVLVGPHRSHIWVTMTAGASTQTWPAGVEVWDAPGAGEVGLRIGIIPDLDDCPPSVSPPVRNNEVAGCLHYLPAQPITLGTAVRSLSFSGSIYPNTFHREVPGEDVA